MEVYVYVVIYDFLCEPRESIIYYGKQSSIKISAKQLIRCNKKEHMNTDLCGFFIMYMKKSVSKSNIRSDLLFHAHEHQTGLTMNEH